MGVTVCEDSTYECGKGLPKQDQAFESALDQVDFSQFDHGWSQRKHSRIL